MKRAMLIVPLLALVACINATGHVDIQEPFRAQILALQKQNFEFQHQCQDLARKQAELQADMQWNASRMQSLAQEAAIAMKYSPASGEWTINLDTLQFIHHPEFAPKQ